MNRRFHCVGLVAARLLRMAKVLAGLLALPPAAAQIVGAPGVAPNLRPTVLAAPSGVPLVNIQTPSAAGVSRNLYQQFDVRPGGVILNNSRTDVQTELGGPVQANPFLANGPARIILNEIVSGNPTQLRGAIEVAGQRAEVIVANPAGIAVDGGTFINASRATLTTGTPQFDAAGGLDGYLVRSGTVRIDGAGLDATSTDYAAILARAVQVNAGIWAKELKAVTGANQVPAAHAPVTPTSGEGARPVFALDLAHLGGMYAGKIWLIGTEHGVGARNAGTILAADGSGPLGDVGELVVTAEGRLENIGTLQARTRADIAAGSVANSGRIASGGDLKMATQGTLGNAGMLEARSLQLASAGDIDNRGGTMRQAGGAGLQVTARGLINTGGGVIGADTGSSGAGEGGSDASTSSASPAPGAITAGGALLNDSGRIHARGPIALETQQLDNAGGSLSVASLAVRGPSFGNAGGSVRVGNSFSAHVDHFDNTGGEVHGGSVQVASQGDLLNGDGAIVSNTHVVIAAGSLGNDRGRIEGHDLAIAATNLGNAAGAIRADASATLTATGRIDNTEGLIVAGDTLSIVDPRAATPGAKTLRVTNTGGTAMAGKTLLVDAASLGFDGNLLSKGDMRLVLNQDVVVAQASRTTADRDLSIVTSGNITNSGTLAAGHALTLSARNIDNTATGDIQGKATRLAASETITNRGVIDGVVTRVDAGTLNNVGTGRIYGDAISLGADTLDNLPETVDGVTSAATIAARHRLDIGARTIENRDGSLIYSDGDMAIRWSHRNSRRESRQEESGGTAQAAGSVNLTAGRNLTARAATLRAGETLSVAAGKQLSLTAGENSTRAETHHASKKGMTQYSLDADSQDTSLARTSLEARNIQLGSGGDMTLSAIDAKAQSLSIDAGGKLDLRTQSTTSAMRAREVDNDAAFSSSSGSGRKDETSQYNRFDAKDLSIRADGGVKAQLGQYDSLATLAQQPGMAWVNQLANDPAFVNSAEWQRVKEEHDSWSYHHSGMGPVTAAVVSLVAAYVAAPAAAQAGAAAGGAASSAGMGAAITAGASSAVQVGVSAIAQRAAVSLANNDGDLGRVIKEMGSSDSIKAIAASMLTAGVIEGLNTSGLVPENIAHASNGSARLSDQLRRQLIDNAAASVVRSAVNGTSLENELRDGLVNALLNTVAAQSADKIGDLTQGPDAILSGFTNKLAHAIAGCAVGAGRAGAGSGCAPGALGAVVGELTAETYGRRVDTVQVAELMAALAAAVAGGDPSQINLAIIAGGNAAAKNFLNHDQWGSFAKELTACGKDPVCEAAARARYADISKKQDAALALCDKAGNCETLK